MARARPGGERPWSPAASEIWPLRHRFQAYRDYGPTQAMIVGEAVTQAVRNREHPVMTLSLSERGCRLRRAALRQWIVVLEREPEVRQNVTDHAWVLDRREEDHTPTASR